MSDRALAATVQATVSAALTVFARRLLPIFLLVVLAYVVWLARDALAPYLMGLLLIYILLPVVHRIEGWIPDKGKLVDFERPIAAFISIFLALILVVGIFAILLDPLITQTMALVNELGAALDAASTDDQGLQLLYQERVPLEIREWVETNIERIGESIVSGSMGAATWFLTVTGSLVSTILALVAVPLFIIFYLIDEKSTPAALRKQLPLGWAEDIVAIFRITDRILGSYTRAVLTQTAIIATITAIGYWLVGIDMALPLGIIAGAGAIVPIVGLWLSLFLTVPILFATQADHVVAGIVVYFAVQLVSGWVLMPKIQGSSVDFTTTGVLLIIAIAGAIAGPLGLIFALPIAAIIRATAVYAYHRLQGDSPEAAIRELRLFQSDADQASASILRDDHSQPVPAATPATAD
ncbi:MAG: AI-2E family transporter [Chloroflexota bacterium]|nr:AI-2E family transporter [Chloroflexota bacterium]